MKKILITGANSYVGTSFEKWLAQYPESYRVDTVDTKAYSWRERNFSEYDVVFHVAGIAHVSTDPKMEDLYYKVNRDLTIEAAKKAKAEGVKQFIFMSSIIVYGDSSSSKRVITAETKPNPSNFYGKSKLEAEDGIKTLESDDFNVVIVRPPMIYGKGSKGNYERLAKLAKNTLLFPDIENERSMLHIDNLCEFLRVMIDNEETGTFFPQNKEYVSTQGMVKLIGEVHGRKIRSTKLFNPILKLGFNFSVVNKAFGNLVYEKSVSRYDKANYQVRSFKESIQLTEGGITIEKKKVLILVNHDVVIYNFRKELVEKLLKENFEVIISSPYGERIDELIQMGCRFIDMEINRHGTNPFQEIKLLNYYKDLMKKEKPDVVLTYTIKPNIYGGIAAKKYGIPYIANITGLGTAVENKGITQRLTVLLYKFAFKKIQTVFFQNKENMEFFEKNKIANDYHKLLPGSGVNLNQFQVLDYPSEETIEFVFISRIMKEKGIDQYIEAAKYIRKKYPNTVFHVCGFCEERYEEKLKQLEDEGILIYHGMLRDVREILKTTHCTVHPSYYPEGISNVLLESSASGRPIITTDRSGCREVVDHNSTGFMVKQKDSNDLINKIEKFIELSFDQKKEMGLKGRKKVREEFDRSIVINKYLKEINVALNL